MQNRKMKRAKSFWKNQYDETVEMATIPDNVKTIIVHFKRDNLLIGKGGELLNDKIDRGFETPVAIVTR